MYLSRWWVLLLALAFAVQAEIPRDADTRSLLAEVADLREDLADGKEFAHLDAQSRQALLDASQHLAALVEPVPRLADLPTAQRAEVDAALAEVNRQLAEAELDRPRCRAERVTGSNRRVEVCSTKRQEQAQGDVLRNALRKPRGCVGSNCGMD